MCMAASVILLWSPRTANSIETRDDLKFYFYIAEKIDRLIANIFRNTIVFTTPSVFKHKPDICIMSGRPFRRVLVLVTPIKLRLASPDFPTAAHAQGRTRAGATHSAGPEGCPSR
jgi:hypothetical protein